MKRQRTTALVVAVAVLLFAGTAPASIIGQHAFTWWDVNGGIIVSPIGQDPAPGISIRLLDLKEWQLDQVQTTAWYNGQAIAGLPANPFNAANRTGLIGAITPQASAEAFIYEITNVNYFSGNGFLWSDPAPPGPGINDLSGINIIDSGGALAISGLAAGSQFISTTIAASTMLDLTAGSVFGTPQDWDFNAYAGGGNFEWDIRSENGAGVVSGLPSAVLGFAMPGNWLDRVNDGWVHSWNASDPSQPPPPPPTSIQVNLLNSVGGFSGPAIIPAPAAIGSGLALLGMIGMRRRRR